MNVLLLVNGYAHSGKDIFAELLKGECKLLNLKVKKISSIDPVKSALTPLGYTGKKTEEERIFLSSVKDAWIKFNNGPFNFIKDKVNIIKNAFNIIIVDVREITEIRKLKSEFSDICKTVFISRINNTVEPEYLCSKWETALISLKHEYDYILYNDKDIASFKNVVIEFLNNLQNDMKVK